MNRCIIIGGGEITRYDRLNGYLRDDDFAVFCDGGLYHAPHLRIAPGLIVGDFDSHAKPETATETIVLPREKDDTDTFFAAKEALKRGYEEFLLIGVTGGRLDHTLVNISILLYLDTLHKKARIVDDRSEMEIVSGHPVRIGGDCGSFSLLTVSGKASGIRITGAKYPLEGGEITCEYQYGISNEVMPGQTATVSVEEGRLLLIRNMK